ncbi:iron-containing alcohol dehydrogenase [Kibdelosporangium aridum]|uniref:iron-containing alcohol dehydrogenase n=1 Tax=Kibdelosporangium aridum TaxID=2030 RepID=UPI0035ECD45F
MAEKLSRMSDVTPITTSTTMPSPISAITVAPGTSASATNNWTQTDSPHRDSYRTTKHYDNSGFLRSSPSNKRIDVAASFSLETRVQFVEGLFLPDNPTLRDIYVPFDRCIAMVDTAVNAYHGEKIAGYFAEHGISFQALPCSAQEHDKKLSSISTILDYLSRPDIDVGRNEPVLVVGGGVLHDIAGLACALLHRRTPYVMVATSLITAIDAGPSPRTGVNANTLKNSFGAFHPPLATFVDRTMFQTLDIAYLRHGTAEIVKMGAVDDITIFELLERHGDAMIREHFATLGHGELASATEELLFRTVHSYLKHEGTNIFEVYEDRPHAYGHTWSNMFELVADLRHGHAVSVEMCFSARVAALMGWINEEQVDRIVELCRALGLAVYHPVLDDIDLLTRAQESVRRRRGGKGLYAPLPRNEIGECDYVEHVPSDLLKDAIVLHRDVCLKYPGAGAGSQMYTSDPC